MSRSDSRVDVLVEQLSDAEREHEGTEGITLADPLR
jgi:hypothetical protein